MAKNNEKNAKKDRVISVITIVLSTVSLILSLGIAGRQNRISLFERRFEVYQTYRFLFENAESANNTLESGDWDALVTEEGLDKTTRCLDLYFSFMGFVVPDAQVRDGLNTNDELISAYIDTQKEVNSYCIKLTSAKYLFNLTENEKSQIDRVVSELKNLISSDAIFLSGEAALKEHISSLLVEIAQIDFLPKMEKML